MARTQVHRRMAIDTPLGPDALLLKSFTMNEQVGRPFQLHVDMFSENPAINFDDIVGQSVTVRVETPSGSTRYFNGLVSGFAQREEIGRLTLYEATVVPTLWLLTRTSDCRIFQEKTVPDIIKEVFRDHGVTDFDERLSGSYRQWEYCVQYRETDFNFVSRLMEHEGIYYFFEHQNGRNTLVLADGPSAHQAFPGYAQIRYHPVQEAASKVEHIQTWRVEKQVRPGTYALNDFDFKDPKKALRTSSKIDRGHAAAHFEIYDYPGPYVQYGDGENYARVRIEELQAQHETVRGEGDSHGIAAGRTFQLTHHPRADQGRGYLVTSTTITGESDEYDSLGNAMGKGSFYQCSFAGMDAEEPLRVPRTTPKPTVQGPQTAIVCGPAGEEIYTDKYARVKVQFHWDRYGKADERASCWIRVAQPWAGKEWGGMSIPRIGQEVIVDFLEGDPDQPIITGRVYNGIQMPPYGLPGQKTKTTLKSNSTKGGVGFNEIRYEDKKGQEQIFVHAERNQDIRVKNDCMETILNNRHLHVSSNQHEHVGANKDLHVGGSHKEKIDGNMQLLVVQSQGIVVGQSKAELIGGNDDLHIVGDRKQKIDGKTSLQVGNERHTKIEKLDALEAGEEIHLKAGMKVVMEAGMEFTIKGPGGFVKIDPGGVTIVGTLVKINTGGSPGEGSGANPQMAADALAAQPAAPTPADDAKTGKKSAYKIR